MAWNKQTGGGWKGSGGPWGQGPRNTGGGSTPPDLEELLRRSQDRLRQGAARRRWGGMRNLSPVTIIAVLLLVSAFVVYNFFTFRVQPNELGVVLRFGSYDREALPGLNWRLPYPIETVYTPQVTTVHQVTVGQVVDNRIRRLRPRHPEESLMLTGDENIVDIDFSVFWVIGDAADYLFNMADPDGTVKAAAESTMRASRRTV